MTRLQDANAQLKRRGVPIAQWFMLALGVLTWIYFVVPPPM
jgi:hypothetical protein